MANTLYPKFKEAALNGDIDLLVSNVRAILIDTGNYTYSASHDFLDDVAAGSRVATSGNLANKSTTNGVFDADDITLTSVSGATVEAVILYVHTGTESTSNLIAYIDTGTGFPFTPNGGDVLLVFSSAASKIFEI